MKTCASTAIFECCYGDTMLCGLSSDWILIFIFILEDRYRECVVIWNAHYVCSELFIRKIIIYNVAGRRYKCLMLMKYSYEKAECALWFNFSRSTKRSTPFNENHKNSVFYRLLLAKLNYLACLEKSCKVSAELGLMTCQHFYWSVWSKIL